MTDDRPGWMLLRLWGMAAAVFAAIQPGSPVELLAQFEPPIYVQVEQTGSGDGTARFEVRASLAAPRVAPMPFSSPFGDVLDVGAWTGNSAPVAVDLIDFALFQSCAYRDPLPRLSIFAADVTHLIACARLDCNGDQAVDLTDYACFFQSAGPWDWRPRRYP